MKFSETFSYGEEYPRLIGYFVHVEIITINFSEFGNVGAWDINRCITLSSQVSKVAHKTSYNFCFTLGLPSMIGVINTGMTDSMEELLATESIFPSPLYRLVFYMNKDFPPYF